MPRKKNAPGEYLPRETIVAMRVAAPYKDVAEWCGGTVVMAGVKFSHILIEQSDGDTLHAPVGSYIQQTDFHGTYIYNLWSEEVFEDLYRPAF